MDQLLYPGGQHLPPEAAHVAHHGPALNELLDDWRGFAPLPLKKLLHLIHLDPVHVGQFPRLLVLLDELLNAPIP